MDWRSKAFFTLSVWVCAAAAGHTRVHSVSGQWYHGTCRNWFQTHQTRRVWVHQSVWRYNQHWSRWSELYNGTQKVVVKTFSFNMKSVFFCLTGVSQNCSAVHSGYDKFLSCEQTGILQPFKYLTKCFPLSVKILSMYTSVCVLQFGWNTDIHLPFLSCLTSRQHLDPTTGCGTVVTWATELCTCWRIWSSAKDRWQEEDWAQSTMSQRCSPNTANQGYQTNFFSITISNILYWNYLNGFFPNFKKLL